MAISEEMQKRVEEVRARRERARAALGEGELEEIREEADGRLVLAEDREAIIAGRESDIDEPSPAPLTGGHYTPRVSEQEFMEQQTGVRERRWTRRLKGLYDNTSYRWMWWPISGRKPVASADTQINRLRKGKVAYGEVRQREHGEEGWEIGGWLVKEIPARKVIVARWVEGEHARETGPVGGAVDMERVWAAMEKGGWELEGVDTTRYVEAFHEAVAIWEKEG